MHTTYKSIVFSLFISFLSFFTVSCNSEFESWGVLLWSPQEATVPSGTLVGIVSISTIQETVTIQIPVSDTTTTMELAPWRVMVFDNKSKAESFIKNNEDWLSMFAVCLRQALPVRETPERNALTVYRLRENETIKVISREAEISDEGGLQDYWYEVLTETGIKGWTFGLYLRTYLSGKENMSVSEGKTGSIDVMARLQQGIWRPEFFTKMIETQKYDLSRFVATAGFFVDPLSKTYRLLVPGHAEDGTYTSISVAPQDTTGMKFLVVGSEIILDFSEADVLKVEYTLEGKREIVNLVDNRANVPELIAQETARRQSQYRRISGNNAVYLSPELGELSFQGDRFTWPGVENLSLSFIPRGAQGAGRAYIDRYHDETLSPGFQGVVTFFFDGTSQANAVPFLYKLTGNTLELLPMSNSGFEDAIQIARPNQAGILTFNRAN